MIVNNYNNYPNYNINFGTYKKFKKMFNVCAYSGQGFEQGNTKTLEHIIPEIRGGKKELSNLIVVKRSINCLRSDTPLDEFIVKHPEVPVQENLLRTLESMKGKIIDGVNWAEAVKKNLYTETKLDIFK